jgi:hypothetical protein
MALEGGGILTTLIRQELNRSHPVLGNKPASYQTVREGKRLNAWDLYEEILDAVPGG